MATVNPHTKKLGQIFTPSEIVERVLDEAGFTEHTFTADTTIFEPSFGTGAFLNTIITRILNWGNIHHHTPETVTRIIDTTVRGIEYDPELYSATVHQLKKRIREETGHTAHLPYLTCGDTLDFSGENLFDYVAGNPPYVRIHNMPADMRTKVKKYAHTTGTTDLYIVFYELGLHWLKPGGTLAYIAPNSWMRNTSQRKFREHLIRTRALTKIVNYGTRVMFPDAATYTCITVLKKFSPPPPADTAHPVTLTLEENPHRQHTTTVPYTQLDRNPSDPLYTMSPAQQRTFNRLHTTPIRTLGDMCTIQNGLATLGDKYFICDTETAAAHRLETEHLLPVVKSSRYRGERPRNKIIFPYRLNSGTGRVVGVTETELAQSAPNIYTYLLQHRANLSGRSLDKGALWFWYGRSQALQATFTEKLVFSPIVGPDQKHVTAYIVPAGTQVYSGLFATVTPPGSGEGNFSLPAIKKIVESENFCEYIKIVGKNMNGGYSSMNSRMVNSYPVCP